MAQKPLILPEWASGGSAQIVEPTSGKKAVGHVPGEPLPAQYENWFKNLSWQWIAFFSEWVFDNGEIAHGARFFAGRAIDNPPVQGSLSFASPGTGVSAWIASAAGQKHRVRIALRTGDRIVSIDWHFFGADESIKTLRLVRNTANLGLGLSENVVTGWSTQSTELDEINLVQDGPDEVIGEFNGPSDVYYAEFVAGAAGDEFYGVYVMYDRPAPTP